MANSKSSAYGRSVDYRRFSICHSLWAKRAADFLLEQAIGMNAELAKQIKELTKEAFLNYLIQHRGIICVTDTFPIWEMSQMVKTIHAIVTNDIDSFQAVLHCLNDNTLNNKLSYLKPLTLTDTRLPNCGWKSIHHTIQSSSKVQGFSICH